MKPMTVILWPQWKVWLPYFDCNETYGCHPLTTMKRWLSSSDCNETCDCHPLTAMKSMTVILWLQWNLWLSSFDRNETYDCHPLTAMKPMTCHPLTAMKRMTVIIWLQWNLWLSFFDCNETYDCHPLTAMKPMTVILWLQWNIWLSSFDCNETYNCHPLTAMKRMTVILWLQWNVWLSSYVRWVVTILFINSRFFRNFGNNLWKYTKSYRVGGTLFVASLVDYPFISRSDSYIVFWIACISLIPLLFHRAFWRFINYFSYLIIIILSTSLHKKQRT
jgi:hypothetical protein